MKTMILLAVLLVASVASAGNDSIYWSDGGGGGGFISSEQLLKPCPKGYIETASGCWLDKGNVTEWQKKGYQPVSNASTSCETQLREALMAIKPYLSFNWGETVSALAMVCEERCQIQKQLEALDRREKVQAQYNAALKCGE